MATPTPNQDVPIQLRDGQIEPVWYGWFRQMGTAVKSLMADKAPIASPSFTGDVVTDGRVVGDGAYNTAQNGGSPGVFDIDATGKPLYTLGVGGTVDFYNMSGIVIVNSHTAGTCEAWVAGAGATQKFATSNGTALGTLTYAAGIGGYRYTASIAGQLNFVVIRTRLSG